MERRPGAAGAVFQAGGDVINETFRPGDDAYWVQTWSRVLFAGDLFAAIPFLDQPAVESIDDDGGGKHYLGPIVYG